MTRVAMIVLHDMAWDRRVDREARALADAGYDVTVFCLQGPDFPDAETRNGYAIRRVASRATAPWTRPLSKINHFRRRERDIVTAVAAHRPSVVHCHDLPTLRMGFRAASGCDARVVFDDHELYPDSLMQRKFQRSYPVQKYWRSIEAKYVPRADAVVTVSPGIARILHERHGVDPLVVLNVPEELLPPCTGSRLRDELGIPQETPIVLYQGLLMEVGRSLTELIEAMARVPDAALVVQGTGDGLEGMKRRAAELGLSARTHFMGWVPTDELYSYTCGVTVGTVFLDGLELSHRHSLPNRLFLYMMAGVSAAVSDLPDMAALVDAEQIGVKVAARDPESMADGINWLIKHPEERQLMAERGRHLSETRFSWATQSQALLDLYSSLTGAPTSEIT